MKQETMLAKAHSESPEFGGYAEYMLEEEPSVSLPVLRELYKHNTSASEYRAHMERVKKGGKP